MSGKGQDRRLAAIVVADVAGYSRLMGRNEEGTVQTLRTYRTQVIGPLLESYGGRIANTAGDSLLVEFPSAVEAVRCSLEFQTAIEQRNEELPDDERLVFRMGINVGDVIAEGGDLLGDGVNVAARLEGVAEPGGIILSRSARDQVRDRLDIDLEDLGEIELKNIARPVRAFRVSRGPAKAGKPETKPSRAVISGPKHGTATLMRTVKRGSVIVRLGAVSAVILVTGLAIWSQMTPLSWSVEPEPDNSLTSPDRTSIAVLPFNNLGGDPGQVYFADGITEDLITDLSKISGLLVISRNSSFTPEARNASIEDIAQAFGVRYILKGSIRYSGEVLRVNAQLVDSATGGTVWGQRFDRDRQEVFQMQDDITTSIVNALEEELLPGELEKLTARDTTNVAAHDAYLRGLALYLRGDPADNAAAAEALRRSISLDSEFVRAKTTLAKVYVQAGIGPQAFATALNIHWSEGLARAWALLGQPASSADADRHVVRSWLALRKHQHQTAIDEARQALELEPSDTDAMEALAEAQIYAGQAESGLGWAERALRQNPGSPSRARFLIGLANFAQNNMEEAISEIEIAIDASPARRAEYSAIHAAALGKLGRTKDAQAAFETFTKGYLERPSKSWTVKAETFQNPRFHTWRNIDTAWTVFNHPFQVPITQERLAEGLQSAGASTGLGGYLSLHRGNRLTNSEISELLLDTAITGSDFWLAERVWRQIRDSQGVVRHSGIPIHAGPPSSPKGTGEVRRDLLCEYWSLPDSRAEICVAIFRIFDERARRRWGEFIMVTDVGPFPFSVTN